MQKSIKVYVASDHAGLITKEAIKEWLLFSNYEVIDFGANIYNQLDDYPDFVHEAGKALSDNNSNLKAEEFLDLHNFAFVFGGSGTGEAIVMNRYKGVRCLGIYVDIDNNDKIGEIVELARKHNNANAISFGARFVNIDSIKSFIKIFLNTSFQGERHISRINKIENML